MSDTYRMGHIHEDDIEIPQGGDFYWALGIIATQLAITGPTVARNTAYTVGYRVIPATPNGYAYDCTTAGTSHATNEPTWPTVVGKTVTDGTVVWTCEGATADREYLLDTSNYTAFLEVRDEDYDGTTVLEANTTNGRIQVGFTPVKWAVNTAYSLDQQVVPTLLNGFVYQCVVAGTSHAATEPTWPTTLGTTVVDNTATWRCEIAEDIDNALVSNVYVQIPASVTEALTDWGRGVYTLQVINTFDQVVFWMDGVARLRSEATY